jgi:hypothetical protein
VKVCRETFNKNHLVNNRLDKAFIDEKEAKRLIACVVSAEIFDVLKKNEPFNLDRFIKCLNKLPAMPWEKEGN